MLVAGLSTGHMIGLAVIGGLFIAFALSSSFVAPRRWPDFPGKNGLSVFVLACFVLFAAMLTAVDVFGVEKSEASTEAHAAAAKTIAVSESGASRSRCRRSRRWPRARYTFVVKNAGKIPHDLVVANEVRHRRRRSEPGGTAKLTVSLAAGTYTLYCTVPGHRAAGMDATLTVG